LDPLTICFAIKAELQPLFGQATLIAREKLSGGSLYKFDKFWMLRTGVGGEKASAVYRQFLKKYTPELVINAGFAGALDPEIDVGEIHKISLFAYKQNVIYQKELKLYDLIDLTEIEILTVDEAVLSRKKREQIFNFHKFRIVDMESYHLADISENFDIPFISIKIISDLADEKSLMQFPLNVKKFRTRLTTILNKIINSEDLSNNTRL